MEPSIYTGSLAERDRVALGRKHLEGLRSGKISQNDIRDRFVAKAMQSITRKSFAQGGQLPDGAIPLHKALAMDHNLARALDWANSGPALFRSFSSEMRTKTVTEILSTGSSAGQGSAMIRTDLETELYPWFVSEFTNPTGLAQA